ncbi:MAG: arylamine N-acetyltransferase [Actinomycetota bacterium]
MPAPLPPLTDDEAAAYLARLGVSVDRVRAMGRRAVDELATAHLIAVPFENLDQVFAGGVRHDLDAAVAKILGGRGGWCFELNGAFARLLSTLGVDVTLLGCAVLLDGPSTVVEHLALEVSGGPSGLPPLLVDVGFGDSFVTPLELNRGGPQPGGNGQYELIASPQGTTVTRLVDGVPEATLRYKRVALSFDDFAGAALRLQSDPARSWSTKPFASRLVGVDERVTLRHDARSRRITQEDGSIETVVEPVEHHDDWDLTLREWFGLERPGPWPPA